mmetsp:Transcript_109311/g.185626  ORF Transcript_109311/g.185626 Transcript_109311/m.185626 type:complete len:134 (+) Transcript_109311:395-796(+)
MGGIDIWCQCGTAMPKPVSVATACRTAVSSCGWDLLTSAAKCVSLCRAQGDLAQEAREEVKPLQWQPRWPSLLSWVFGCLGPHMQRNLVQETHLPSAVHPAAAGELCRPGCGGSEPSQVEGGFGQVHSNGSGL